MAPAEGSNGMSRGFSHQQREDAERRRRHDRGDGIMKLFAAGLVLAIAATSPALGQTKSKKARVASEPKAWQAPAVIWGGAANRRPRSPNPQWDVYRSNGDYAGTDPDPHIRAMLRRDDPNGDP